MEQAVIGNITNEQLNLINRLRKLWADQVMAIVTYILSTKYETEALQAVANELLRISEYFADVLRPFYGDENAARFESLFSNHLFIGLQLIKAIYRGFPRDIEEQHEKWYDTADSIAQFFSEINPNWQKSDWQKMLYDYMSLIEFEAKQIFTDRFAQSIAQYYSIQNEALKMADAMAYGTFWQFPSLTQSEQQIAETPTIQ